MLTISGGSCQNLHPMRANGLHRHRTSVLSGRSAIWAAVHWNFTGLLSQTAHSRTSRRKESPHLHSFFNSQQWILTSTYSSPHEARLPTTRQLHGPFILFLPYFPLLPLLHLVATSSMYDIDVIGTPFTAVLDDRYNPEISVRSTLKNTWHPGIPKRWCSVQWGDRW